MQFITTFVTNFVPKFITKFGDSLSLSPHLVTNLVTNLSQKTLGVLPRKVLQISFYDIKTAILDCENPGTPEVVESTAHGTGEHFPGGSKKRVKKG